MKHLLNTFLILVSLAFLSFLFLPNKAEAIALKENSVVTDDTIKLGDLFSGLSHNENRVLGASPRPGSEMVLNARTLMRVAIAMDLPWRPATSNDFIVLRRAATVINRDTIEDTIKNHMYEEGISGKFKLIIPNGMDELILPQNMPGTVEVSDFDIREDKGFFEAYLVAPSKDNPHKTLRVAGSVEKLIDIPVLRNTLRAGDVIGSRDIETIEISEHDLQHSMILDPTKLIGMTPRRMVLERTPIKDTEVEAPVMVERGDLIMMTFKQGPLVLSARGKALQDGAEGDSIRVVNLSSNKTIEAQVSGTREVIVTTE